MKLNRRSLIKNLAYGTCGSLVHSISSPLLGGNNAWAVGGNNGGLIFILVNLEGGASYNMTPLYDGIYRDANSSISYGPESSLPINNFQGLHPELKGLKSIYDGGDLALLNLVGYPNPSQSHFDSMDVWFRGIRNKGSANGNEGWAARLTCQLGNTFAGIALAGNGSLLISGACNPPKNIGSLATIGERPFFYPNLGIPAQELRTTLTKSSAGFNNDSYRYVRRQHDETLEMSKQLKDKKNFTLPKIANPFPPENDGDTTEFVNSCRDAAKLLADPNLGVRFVYLSRDGFDTHENEKSALTINLKDVNQGLTSLAQTLKALGVWERTVIVTMSEFSRTFENGSLGTDHGHSAPMLLMGGAVRGGVVNSAPSAALIKKAKDVDGFFKDYEIDFRSVFGDIVRKMNLNVGKIFPEPITFSQLNLFK
jgi:uncharacterized protein (DUF1501 family)